VLAAPSATARETRFQENIVMSERLTMSSGGLERGWSGSKPFIRRIMEISVNHWPWLPLPNEKQCSCMLISHQSATHAATTRRV
jgi:hypothetical protein